VFFFPFYIVGDIRGMDMKEVFDILSTELFRSLLNNKNLKITQLNAVIRLLIKGQVPFDLTYTPGTARVAAQAQLTVFVRSGVSVNITITFEAGEFIFN